MTGLVADPIVKDHDTGPTHPESPARFDAVWRGLEKAGLLQQLVSVPSRRATEEQILLCHTREYLELVKAEVSAGRYMLSTGDTVICPRSFEVALWAVGGVLNAVDSVFEGQCANAFCLIRPPGHHATPNRGMGFCIFNNVAIAARYAQQRYGISRVLIIDWDVHHGNGTQDIFYEDGSVFYFSTHQWPWYPGTGLENEIGVGPGKGTTLNCPLPAGSGRKEIFSAFEQKLVPAMETFRPEFILISAGFDSRLGDPLGRFTLLDEDFADLTRLVGNLAERYANGRLVSVLEGGYNLEGLASAVRVHVATLAGLSSRV